MIVFGDPSHGVLIAQAAGATFNPQADVVFSREESGELLGGVIFHSWTKASIRVHVARVGEFGQRWGNRALLWVVFDYAFRYAGCKVIIGETPSSNLSAIDFMLHLGFTPVAEIPDVFPDGGLIISTMQRDTCRWLKMRPPSALLKMRIVK